MSSSLPIDPVGVDKDAEEEPMTTTNDRFDIEIRMDNERALRQVLDRFRHVSPSAGLTAAADDRSSIGAFDSEWIIGLLLCVPVGITASLIAAWIKDTLSPPLPEGPGRSAPPGLGEAHDGGPSRSRQVREPWSRSA